MTNVKKKFTFRIDCSNTKRRLNIEIDIYASIKWMILLSVNLSFNEILILFNFESILFI